MYAPKRAFNQVETDKSTNFLNCLGTARTYTLVVTTACGSRTRKVS
jgi:hypothetical protein